MVKTCIMCPIGCELHIDKKQNGDILVSGNGCIRGEEYAKSEVTKPMRTVTSLVRYKDSVYSVKTTKPVPKELIGEVLKEINNIVLLRKPRYHEVIIKNVLKTGADVIITRE